MILHKNISKALLMLSNYKGRTYAQKGQITLDFPDTISIEATNNCNVKCIMCPYPRMTRKKGFMDFRLYKAIVDEGAEKGLKRISFSIMGDPLIHPEIDKFVQYSIQRNIWTGVSTNAVALNENMGKALIKAGLDFIHISFDGANKASYENIRLGGNFEKVSSNIFCFLDYLEKAKYKRPFVQLAIIKMPEIKKEEIYQYIRQWTPYILKIKRGKILIKSFLQWAGQVDGKFYKVIKNSNKYLLRLPCAAFEKELAVYWNGDVVPCCYDSDNYLNIGNLRAKSIKEIWHGERRREFIKWHSSLDFHKIPLCGNCEEANKDLLSLLRGKLWNQWRRLRWNKLKIIDFQ